VLLEGWFQLTSTAGFQRLAAYLPGLVRPYRQVGLLSMTREAYPSDLLLWLGDCYASKLDFSHLGVEGIDTLPTPLHNQR